MKNLSKKILGIVIAILILLSTNLSIAATESELSSQKAENEEKIENAKDQQEEINEAKNTVMEEVNALNNQIGSYQSQISGLDSQIDEANKKIEAETNKLNEAQAKYDDQQEIFNTRVVALYEMGETTYLDYLLSADSITEFLSTYYIMSEIAEADTNMLEEIQKQKEEIEKTKQELENSKNELTTAKADKERVAQQLQNTKSQKDKYVAQLSEEDKKLQSQLEELQQANIQIEQEIKEAQRKYQEQIAALENNKNNSSNGSSSGGNYTGGGSGRFQRPVASGTITATMYYPSGGYHGALDYGVPVGTPVYAADTGVVLKTANLTSSYGTYVVIQHSGGLQTWYAHGTPGSICVSPGQTVSRGQQIMKSGNSGNSSGAHLHFEVRVAPYDYNTCRVDPRKYL